MVASACGPGERNSTTSPAGEATPASRRSPASPAADEHPKASRVPYRVAALQFVIAHAKAFHPKATRSRDEALELATRLASIAPDADFEALCRRWSDDAHAAENGGAMGVVLRGQLSADFEALEAALFELEIGEVTGPVETPLGFHVVKRVPIREWAASHILVRHAASTDPPGRAPLPKSKREHDEARALAEKLRAKLADDASAEDFAALARSASEGLDRHSGGSLGVFTPGVLPASLENAVRSIQVGEIAGPIESPFGFHIVRRSAIRRALVRGVREAAAESVESGPVLDSAGAGWPSSVRVAVESLAVGEISEPMTIGGETWRFQRVE